MEGQLSDLEFRQKYPNAEIHNASRTCVTRYGKNTYNVWYQHSDGSWTNSTCKTIY